MNCRCCSRCGGLVIQESSTLAPESGELRRRLRPRLLVLCAECADDFMAWLQTPHELSDALYPEPTRSGV